MDVIGLALLGPSINNVFNNIVAGLTGTPTPTPSPTPLPSPDLPRLINAFLGLGGSIYSVRMQDKALALDVTFNYDAANLKTSGDILKVDLAPAVAAPKNVSGTLLDAIPADAGLVLIGSDIPQIYDSNVRVGAAGANALQLLASKPVTDNVLQGLNTQVQGGALLGLGLDFNKDVLGWMGGDYAASVTEEKGGLIDSLSGGQLPVDENVLNASLQLPIFQIATLLGPFEIAYIVYSQTRDGVGTSSFVLMQK